MIATQNGVRRRHRPTRLPRLKINTGQLAQLPPSFGSSPGNSSPTQIHDRFPIFVGGEADACDRAFLDEQRITRVISIQCRPLAAEQRVDGIEYHFFQAADSSSQDLKQHFTEACELLENNSIGATLVHCQQGISRSVTLCLAFLMKRLVMPFDECFQALKARRQCVSPNFAFLGQLKMWESECAIENLVQNAATATYPVLPRAVPVIPIRVKN